MRAWPKNWPLLGLTCLLTSCMLGPEYSKPSDHSLGLDQPFRSPTAAKDVGDNLAAKSWQAIYQDPHLQSLIEQALRDNLDMETAQSRLRQAKSDTVAAKAKLYPRIDAAFDGGREKDAGDPSEGAFSLFALLSWEIDLWGSNRRALQAAEASEQSAEFQLYAIQVSLIGSIAQTYFDLLDLDHQLHITNATIVTRREAVRILRLRHDSGIISGLEVKQAELALAEAKSSVPQLEQTIWTTENELAILIGSPPAKFERGRLLADRVLPEDIPAGLPAELLLRRPDLRAAEQALVAANARIGIAKGRFFPTLTLTGEVGSESSQLDQLLSSGTDYFDFTAGLRQPLFNAGENKAALTSSEEAYNQALIDYRRAVLEALREVSNGLNAINQSKLQTEAQAERLAAANEYLRLAELQYRNGVSSYLDVLDAQRQQFDAELALSSAHQNRLRSIAFTYRALGGGWTAEDADH